MYSLLSIETFMKIIIMLQNDESPSLSGRSIIIFGEKENRTNQRTLVPVCDERTQGGQ